jgi:hypothetical protein
VVICRQCGTANEDSESYCTNCGAKLPSPTPVAKDAETPAAVSRTVVTGPVIALPPESAGAAAVAEKPDGPVTQGAELPKARLRRTSNRFLSRSSCPLDSTRMRVTSSARIAAPETLPPGPSVTAV